jgi:molybdopterin-guanine dinucleotide biosynthesis protein A
VDRAEGVAQDPRLGASGIVLAGGRSSRFGSDKLLTDWDGKPLVEHAIAAVGKVCQEVIVVTGPEHFSLVARLSGHVVEDQQPFQGPLVGARSGLQAAALPIALVVGGDMPTLVPAVLRLLLERLAASDADAAILGSAATRQALPLAVRRAPGLDRAQGLLGDGERSLQSLVEALGAVTIDESIWRLLDPDAATLRDIDRPADLPEPSPR